MQTWFYAQLDQKILDGIYETDVRVENRLFITKKSNHDGSRHLIFAPLRFHDLFLPAIQPVLKNYIDNKSRENTDAQIFKCDFKSRLLFPGNLIRFYF